VNGDFNNVFTGEQGQRTMGPPKKFLAAAGVKHKRSPSLGMAEEAKRRKDGEGGDEGGGDAATSPTLPAAK
jgi:hypothetical protein